MAQIKKGIPYRKKLAAVFISLTILAVGTMSLTESMAIDYYSVINTLMKIIPASLVMGGLGWVMGMILDQPKRRSRRGYGNSFVNNIMKNSLPASMKESSGENGEESS